MCAVSVSTVRVALESTIDYESGTALNSRLFGDFGDFSKAHQKWLYILCYVLEILPAFVDSVPLFSLQMP